MNFTVIGYHVPEPTTLVTVNLMEIPWLALGFALLLGLHGLRKGSLSPSGAFTAVVVGTGTMAGGVRVFGAGLIGFYLLGSRATKYGKIRKAKLEDGYVEAGYRSGWQVLSNSVGALAAALVWNAMFVPASVQAHVLSGIVKSQAVYTSDGWCAVDGGWSRMLVFAALGHFGCCLGDTLASELGILSDGAPRLVTTMRTVPPGTNGGMSVGGTLWSFVGGTLIGLVMAVCLVMESGACSMGMVGGMVGWGGFAGLFGSLVDSLLGATVQRTRYSLDRRLILQDSTPAEHVQVISGWDVLSNNQVNLISSLVSAAVLMAIS